MGVVMGDHHTITTLITALPNPLAGEGVGDGV
jgi:hypothetical protein